MDDERNRLLILLETAGTRLHGLLVRLTLREDVAEDLMQDLFLKLSQAKGFQRADDPIAYAHRAAIHLAFDWRRSRARNRPADAFLTDPAADAPTPLNCLIQREEYELVLGSLDKLSELGRDVLLLRYLEQESYEAIGRQLGKTPHQVRALCHKAIVRLRSLLNESSTLMSEEEVGHVES